MIWVNGLLVWGRKRQETRTTLPWVSPTNWISMCRGVSMYFSTNILSSPVCVCVWKSVKECESEKEKKRERKKDEPVYQMTTELHFYLTRNLVSILHRSCWFGLWISGWEKKKKEKKRIVALSHTHTHTHHATRMPLPPPPALALIITGNPIEWAVSRMKKGSMCVYEVCKSWEGSPDCTNLEELFVCVYLAQKTRNNMDPSLLC